ARRAARVPRGRRRRRPAAVPAVAGRRGRTAGDGENPVRARPSRVHVIVGHRVTTATHVGSGTRRRFLALLRADGCRERSSQVEILVQKYGGSSVATLERVHHVARRIAESHRAGCHTVVVVSARGDTTDELLRLAGETSATRPPREVDQLLASGECASAALLAIALNGLGVPAVSLTGPQAGVRAAGRHGAGVIASVQTRRIRRLLERGNVVVV